MSVAGRASCSMLNCFVSPSVFISSLHLKKKKYLWLCFLIFVSQRPPHPNLLVACLPITDGRGGFCELCSCSYWVTMTDSIYKCLTHTCKVMMEKPVFVKSLLATALCVEILSRLPANPDWMSKGRWLKCVLFRSEELRFQPSCSCVFAAVQNKSFECWDGPSYSWQWLIQNRWFT